MTGGDEDLLRFLREASLIMAPPGKSFTLASGQQSDRYYCMRRASLKSGWRLRQIAMKIASLIPDDIDRVGAVPTGGLVTLGSVLSALDDLHNDAGRTASGFYVRSEVKSHGLNQRVEGCLEGEGDVVLIEDTVSTGQSVEPAVQILMGAPYSRKVRAVICLLDRELGGRERLAVYGVPLVAAYTVRDFEG